MISVVHPESLDYVWPKIEDKIARALKHGSGDGETLENYYQKVQSGEMCLIVAHEGDDIYAGGILSTQIHPNKTTLFVEIVAGRDLDLWIDEAQDALRKIKQENRADTIEASCRPGLAKRLRAWRTKAIIMELPDVE